MDDNQNQVTPATEQGLEAHTLRELQAMATEEGVVGAEIFTTKAQVIGLLQNIKAMKAANAPVLVDPTAAKVSPEVVVAQEKNWQNKTDRTKAMLATQSKVRVMIPLDIGEKRGAYETVIINGYRQNIMKGVMVEVPEAVAKIIEESYRLTAEAGQELLIDRIDPKTGLPVAERLS